MRERRRNKGFSILKSFIFLTTTQSLFIPYMAKACDLKPLAHVISLQSVTSMMLDIGMQALAAKEEACRTKFLGILKKKYPDGYRIWSSLGEESKVLLKNIIKCDANGEVSPNDISTLVHESVHLFDGELTTKNKKITYRLMSGKELSFTSWSNDLKYEFTRGQALKSMSDSERRIMRAKLYLEYHGADDFASLLDELNAYSHDLKTLLHLPTVKTNTREAPLEMTVFALRYLESMERQSPDYYAKRIMGDPELLQTTKALIQQAYDVYNESCERTDLNMDDQRAITALGTKASKEVLTTLFGKNVPTISARCLETAKTHEGGFELANEDYPREPKVPEPSTQPAPSSESAPLPATRLEIPQKKCDPSKPCVIFHAKRISDSMIEISWDIGDVHIQQIMSLDPNGSSITWNGEKITPQEMEKRMKANPALVKMLENVGIEEVKADAKP